MKSSGVDMVAVVDPAKGIVFRQYKEVKQLKKEKHSLADELRRSRQAEVSAAYNKRVIKETQKLYPYKPMSAGEFCQVITRLGLTQQQAGIWLGLSPRQGQRYGSGEVEIPGPVAKLLRLVLGKGIRLRDV